MGGSLPDSAGELVAPPGKNCEATLKLIAKAVAPEAAKSRDEAMRPLADAEKGWRSTKRQIAECGGILLDANGGITE